MVLHICNRSIAVLLGTVMRAAVLFSLILMPTVYAEDAHDPHAHHRHAAKESKMAMADINVPAGLAMLNQYGDSVDLREDVIGNKVVVIGFVYTTCTTVCPVVSAVFSMVRDRLHDKMGKDVELIMITVDPARDTPHRLLSYSKKYNADSGWSWLTGDKKTVDKALSAFGAYTPSFEDHPAMVLIGNASNSEWYRYFGFPSPEDIEGKVNEILNSRAG